MVRKKVTKKVTIDAGHGGHDTGAAGLGYKEKDIVLPIAKAVSMRLREEGLEVQETRTTDDFVTLQDRARMANGFGADIFVSVHINAFKPDTHGVLTIHNKGSKEGEKLARELQDRIKGYYRKDRGLMMRDNLYVLRATKMHAALLELGFITDRQDMDATINRQSEIVESDVGGILAYLKVEKKEEGQ